MDQISAVERELSQRIIWFIRLRWLAATGALTAVIATDYVLKLEAPLVQLLSVVAFIAIYNAICQFLAGQGESSGKLGSQRWSATFANVQISLDLVSLTLLLHFSGGIENPFSLYFLFHIIIASILLSRRAAFLQAGLAVLLVNSMALGEMMGWISHVHLQNFLLVELNEQPVYVLAIATVFTTTIAISALMATSITQRLRAHEKTVLALSNELSNQHQKLQEAYELLSHTQKLQVQYMRKVSHELRSPLAAIDSMLTLIVGHTVTDEAKRLELIQRSLNRIKSLLRTVNDLLLLLRSREAKAATELQPVDVQSVVDKVLDLLATRADQEKVSLAVEVQPSLSPVMGDPEGVEQLIMNLVSNGLKYTPEGGSVRLSVVQEEGSLVITVRDTGIGIAQEDVPKIFGEFYRTRQAREFAAVGTGLGLSIVRSIVDSLGGTIGVQSEVGKGTAFTVALPTIRSADTVLETRREGLE